MASRKKKAPAEKVVDFSDFETPDVEAGGNAGKNALRALGKLAQKQAKAEKKLGDLEAKVKLATEELRLIAEVEFVTALDDVGLSEVKLPSGISVEIEDDVKTSIKKDNKVAAYTWLRDNDLSAIIKNQVVVIFGRGKREDQKAQTLVRNASKKYGEGQVGQTTKVEPQTLKKVMKELLADGKVDVPLELFSIYRLRRTKLK